MRASFYRPLSIGFLLLFACFMAYRSVITGIQLHRVIQYSPDSGLQGYAHILSLLLHVLLLSVSLILIAVIYRAARRKKRGYLR